MGRKRQIPHKLVRRMLRGEKGRFRVVRTLTETEYEKIAEESPELADKIVELDNRLKLAVTEKEAKKIESQKKKIMRDIFKKYFASKIREKFDEYIEAGETPDNALEKTTKFVKEVMGISREKTPRLWGYYINFSQELLESAGREIKGGGSQDAVQVYGDQFKELLWLYHLTGKTAPEIAEQLFKDGYPSLRDKNKPMSERTIRNLLKKYPPPKEIGDVFENDPAIRRLKKWWLSKPKGKQTSRKFQQRKLNVLRDIWEYLGGKPPSTWTKKDLYKYVKNAPVEKDIEDIQSLLIPIRDFIVHGLQKPQWLTEEAWLFVGKMAKPKARTYTFKPEDVPRILNLVDEIKSHSFTETVRKKDKKTGKYKKTEVERHVRLNDFDKLMFKTAFMITASTGARSGTMPTYHDFIQAVLTGDKRYIRPTDLMCVTVFNIDFESHKITKAYAKLHREQGWLGIYLPPKTFKLIKQYVAQKYDVDPNLDDVEFGVMVKQIAMRQTGMNVSDIDYVIDYYYNRVRELLTDYIADKETPLPLKIEKILQDKERLRLIKRTTKEFIETWRKIALFTDKQREQLSLILKTVVDYANTVKKQPLRDQYDDDVWTVHRMKQVEKHTWHLLRRLYAQTLIANNVPMEVISDYGFGWGDLTTLKDMYGSMPRKRLMQAEKVLEKVY